MTTEDFSALVVKIWRLRMRRSVNKALGNRRGARWAQTRIENLCKELSKC